MAGLIEISRNFHCLAFSRIHAHLDEKMQRFAKCGVRYSYLRGPLGGIKTDHSKRRGPVSGFRNQASKLGATKERGEKK